MKVLKILALVAKFGAYVMVVIDVVEFAIEKITPLLNKEKTVQNDK